MTNPLTFHELGVPADLADVLAADGKTAPFPIQRDTLPDSLAGRDVLGRGRTGSGKTIAFSLPLVARLAASGRRTTPRHPRGLVLAPTRELATQIAATIEPLARTRGLRVTTIFGGVKQTRQVEALRSGVDIVVACPGRLEDLMKQGEVSLDSVEVTVLDEADHMADLGFLPGVTRILAATPSGGQRLLFSATLDRGVDKLTTRFLDDPVTHSVDDDSVPQGEMEHRVFVVRNKDAKLELVRELASGTGRRILFTRTKHIAKKIARQLTAAGIPAVDLQGNLSQNARDRNLAAFSAEPGTPGSVRVLVATDVAARGVHVDEVELVVHVDPPVEHKAYLHRSGRTARAGASGVVVTVAIEDEQREVKDLLRRARITAPFEQVSAQSAAVDELVGERAPHVEPAPPQQPTQPQAKSGGSRNGRSRGGRGRSRGGRTATDASNSTRTSDSSANAARRRQGDSTQPQRQSHTPGTTARTANPARLNRSEGAAPRRRGTHGRVTSGE